MGSKMIEILTNLVLLAMKSEYEENTMIKIKELLGEIFESKEVILEKNVGFDDQYIDNIDENTAYIPIIINEKKCYFYIIKNPKNQFAYLLMDSLTKILSEMFINKFVRLPNLIEKDVDLSTNVCNQNAFIVFKNKFQFSAFECVGCVFIDINGMNDINNEYGHKYGDDVILSVANAVKEVFSDENVFRTGGDEFVVITTEMNERMFQETVARLYERIANDSLNVSVGSVIERNVEDINALIDKADERMYQEKGKYYESKGMPLRKIYRRT